MFETDFEVMKKFKILEFEGDWVELHKPIYTENTQKNI